MYYVYDKIWYFINKSSHVIKTVHLIIAEKKIMEKENNIFNRKEFIETFHSKVGYTMYYNMLYLLLKYAYVIDNYSVKNKIWLNGILNQCKQSKMNANKPVHPISHVMKIRNDWKVSLKKTFVPSWMCSLYEQTFITQHNRTLVVLSVSACRNVRFNFSYIYIYCIYTYISISRREQLQLWGTVALFILVLYVVYLYFTGGSCCSLPCSDSCKDCCDKLRLRYCTLVTFFIVH